MDDFFIHWDYAESQIGFRKRLGVQLINSVIKSETISQNKNTLPILPRFFFR